MSTEFSVFAPPSLASAASTPLPPPPPVGALAAAAATAPAPEALASLPSLPLVAPAPHVLATPATPAPAPAAALPVAALPVAALPVPALPVAALPVAALPVAALPVAAQPVAAAPAFHPAPAPVTPPSSKKSPRQYLAKIVGVALIAGAGVLAYSALSGPDDAATPSTEQVTDAGDVQEIEPASPILVPINEAENAVDELSDRAEEIELLEQLGLDANGRPIPPGYRFATTDPFGSSLSIQVDTTTGNYSVESADGFAFRSIDGATVARESATDAWTPVDAAQVDGVQRFGLDSLVAETDIVTPAINPWVSVEDRVSLDGRETTSYRIDVAAIQAEQPGALAEWAAPFGLDADAVVTAASAPVSIEIVLDTQRMVQSFTIDAPGANGTVSYRLETVYNSAPAISL